MLNTGKHCHINSSVFQLLTTGCACPSSLLPSSLSMSQILMYTQKNRKFSAWPISPQEMYPRVNALNGLLYKITISSSVTERVMRGCQWKRWGGGSRCRFCSSYAAGKTIHLLVWTQTWASDVCTTTKCLFLAPCRLHPRYHLSFVPPSKTGPQGSDRHLRKGAAGAKNLLQTYFKHIL